PMESCPARIVGVVLSFRHLVQVQCQGRRRGRPPGARSCSWPLSLLRGRSARVPDRTPDQCRCHLPWEWDRPIKPMPARATTRRGILRRLGVPVARAVRRGPPGAGVSGDCGGGRITLLRDGAHAPEKGVLPGDTLIQGPTIADGIAFVVTGGIWA